MIFLLLRYLQSIKLDLNLIIQTVKFYYQKNVSKNVMLDLKKS